MKKNRWYLRALVLLVVCGALNLTVSAAAEAGSSGDPLVTVSYLNETFLPALLQKVDAKITARNAALQGQTGGGSSSTAETFSVVTLAKGQTLKGGIGCEVMLRVGTAVCVSPSNPGLIDETGGTSLGNNGALMQNHLYMMTIEGRGVKATAATVKVLARGSYTIG